MVGNIIGGCLFESVLTIWCSSLLEDECHGDHEHFLLQNNVAKKSDSCILWVIGM